MPQVYVVHPQTGQTVPIESADLAEALNAGFILAEGEQDAQVPVTTYSGQERSVGAGELEGYVTANPYTGVVDPAELAQREAGAFEAEELQREHGGIGGQVGAFLEGGVDALSLGGYGALNKAIGGDYAARAEANPGLHVGGETVGLIGSLFIPGGAAAQGARGAEAVGGAARAAGVLGKVVSRTPAGFVSGKSLALAEHIGGLKGAMAGQALEGAVYGTSQTLSGAYVHDAPLTASSLWSEVGRNALFGAGMSTAGSVLAHSLSKYGGRLADRATPSAEPILNMAAPEARAATKSIAKHLDRIDNVADNLAANVEGRVAARPFTEEVLDSPLSTGARRSTPVAEEAAVVGPPEPTGFQWGQRAEKIIADASTPNIASAPLQRQKIAASAGDQVLDTGMELGAFTPKEVRRLKRLYADMDEAVNFANEVKSKAAVAGANRALSKYEDEVSAMAKKAGLDIEDQLARTGREFHGAEENLLYRRSESVDVKPIAEPPPTPRSKPEPELPKYRATEQVGTSGRAVDNVAAADLRNSMTLAKEALGLKAGQLITGDAVRSLFTKSPDEILSGLNRFDDALESVRAFAEKTGDAQMLRRLDVAENELSETISTLTGGAKLSDIDRAVIAEALSSESMAKAKFKSAAVEKLHEMAAISRLTGQKLPKGVAKKHLVGGLLMSASARAAARGASRLGNQMGGGGLVGAIAGGAGAATAFHAVRMLAGLTKGTVNRISGAVGKAATRASKAVRPAVMTGAWFIRESRWGLDEKSVDKPTKQSLREAFADRANELARIAANPAAAQMKIHDQLAPLWQLHPHVADELEMLAINTPQYLMDKMPKDPGNVMRWGKSEWRPSDYQILQWGEHFRGALAPIETFEDMMETGYITPQAAEAIRTLHRPLYDKMQEEVFMRADELREKLDHGGQVRISVFFQVPVTSTMRPEFRAFLKERHMLRAQTQSPTGRQNMGVSGGSADAAEPLTGAQQLLKQ